MKSKLMTVIVLLLLTLIISSGVSADYSKSVGVPAPALAPIGTTFTYQGYLTDGGSPANGAYDFELKLYNDVSVGTQAGSTVALNDVNVSEGIFTVELDFGDVFEGTALWLEIGVRPGASTGSYQQLLPRQPLRPTPYAINADMLDGQHASELGVDYQNVIIVAKSGGDYTSVQTAIDTIAGATADNPYLVRVAPGEYSETVTMKPYVHLQGAGQEATVITSTTSNSAWPPTQATLVLSSDASLRDLTVGNGSVGDYNAALLATVGVTRTLVADVTVRAQGGGARNYGIFLTGIGTDVTLQQVTAMAENGSNTNLGLLIFDGAAAMLRGGSFTGRGGTDAFGIFNLNSDTTLEAESVTALAENGSARNFGLYNYGGAEATLRGGSFTGRGGVETRGIENANSGSTLTAQGVTALGENGSNDNYGLGSYNNATTTLYGGSFTGRGGTDTYGIANGASSTTLEAESVTALAEKGSDDNYGLHSFNGGETTLHGGSFTGSGGVFAYGIYNTDVATMLEAESVSALGKLGIGSTASYGLYNVSSATANVTQSVLEGGTNSVYRGTGAVVISNSRLTGTAVSGTVTCVLVTRDTTISTDGSTCP